MEQKELEAIKSLVTRFQEQPWDYLAFELARFVPGLIADLETAWAKYDAYLRATKEVLDENIRLQAKEAALRKAVEDRRASNRALRKTEWNCVSIDTADEYMTWVLSLLEAT